jgi:hypothetical protein
MACEASPPFRAGVLPCGRASRPGEEDNKHFHIAPLDPLLKDGRSVLRQHFVRGERAGQCEDYCRRNTLSILSPAQRDEREAGTSVKLQHQIKKRGGFKGLL